MALLLHRDAPPPTAAPHPSPMAPVERTGPSQRFWRQRVVAVGLWTLVGGGFVLGALAFVRPVPAETGSVSAPVDEARWDVTGFAEEFVTTFLNAGDGSEEALKPFLGARPDALTGVVPGEWFASRSTTVSLDRLGPARWGVTVAVDLLRRDGPDTTSPFVGLGTRYFRVEVVERDTLVAAGLPALVAGPATGEPVDDGWPSGAPPASDDPLADTVRRFLTALLTGTGDLGRYAAQGSGLRAASATFETVTVERLAVRGVDDRRRVRVWMTGVSGPASLQLVYDLQLTRRAGRWEVDAVGTPAAAAPSPPATWAAPSTTATTSGS